MLCDTRVVYAKKMKVLPVYQAPVNCPPPQGYYGPIPPRNNNMAGTGNVPVPPRNNNMAGAGNVPVPPRNNDMMGMGNIPVPPRNNSVTGTGNAPVPPQNSSMTGTGNASVLPKDHVPPKFERDLASSASAEVEAQEKLTSDGVEALDQKEKRD